MLITYGMKNMPRNAVRNLILELRNVAIANDTMLTKIVATTANWIVNTYESRMRSSLSRLA